MYLGFYVSCVLAESAFVSFLISRSGAGRYQNLEWWCGIDRFLNERPEKRQVTADTQMAVQARVIIASFSHSIQPLCN
jgi:hypothetical protein